MDSTYLNYVQAFRESNDYGYPFDNFQFNFTSKYDVVKNITLIESGKNIYLKPCDPSYYNCIKFFRDKNSIFNVNVVRNNDHHIIGHVIINVNPEIIDAGIVIFPSESYIDVDHHVGHIVTKFSSLLKEDFMSLEIFAEYDFDKLFVTDDNKIYYLCTEMKIMKTIAKKYSKYLFDTAYKK